MIVAQADPDLRTFEKTLAESDRQRRRLEEKEIEATRLEKLKTIKPRAIRVASDDKESSAPD